LSGILSIAFGIVLIALGPRLNGFRKRLSPPGNPAVHELTKSRCEEKPWAGISAHAIHARTFLRHNL
jgi:hypothetical protein